MTTRVVSTGIASSTPAVVWAPPQDSATRLAASSRMPTRSVTRRSTFAMGINSASISPPITSDLPSSGGMNLRKIDIVLLPGASNYRECGGVKWHDTCRNCGES
jgi:hypothetical protein